jgi:hypothetical protein
MRKTIGPQIKMGEVDISKIEFDLRSRDEIPKLLLGLQYIYVTPEIRKSVFQVLEEIIPEGTDPNNGCPGMDLWKILVLGTLRLDCNWDYDKLQDIANNHKTLRQMLGHGFLDDSYRYALQTLKDNVSLFTQEALDKINQLVVKAGHDLSGKKKGDDLKGKSDSFVLETDVHYPTDINLLFDAIRKVIALTAQLCSDLDIRGWRQSNYTIKRIKKFFRKARKLKRSNSKKAPKKAKRERLIIEAHQAYIDLVGTFLEKAKQTLDIIRKEELGKEDKLQEIEAYIQHAQRQIEQIQRRVIAGEKIPHEEKVFSIFEEHTEWICKGKAGISQELGLKVCILEDQYRFILHYQVMEKQDDSEVAVSMIEQAKEKFPDLTQCSFDKGFYTPDNRVKLSKILDRVIMPKKGRLSE